MGCTNLVLLLSFDVARATCTVKYVYVCAGLAAGFDKDAEAIEGLMGIGFGFVEVGESLAPTKPMLITLFLKFVSSWLIRHHGPDLGKSSREDLLIVMQSSLVMICLHNVLICQHHFPKFTQCVVGVWMRTACLLCAQLHTFAMI